MLLQRISRLFAGKKGKFKSICKANGITLDYKTNKKAQSVLKEIFEQRAYSDYFPFYQKATIVDIGAHVGYFSIFSAINSGPQSTILAIEPETENFNTLVANINVNAMRQVLPLKAAIGATSGSSLLHKSDSVNNTLLDNYPGFTEKYGVQKTEVKTLAQLMTEHSLDKIDFLKMDCEGAEYAILETTPRQVLDKITTISMEFHDLKHPKYNGNFLVRLLIMNDFEIVKFMHDKTSLGLNYGKIIATKINPGQA